MSALKPPFVFSIFALGLLSCGNGDLAAGGAGNETTNGIQGQVLSSSGQPQSGALVRALPTWYVQDSLNPAEFALPSRRWAVTSTDDQGHFALEGLTLGNYQIEVRQGNSGAWMRLDYPNGDTLLPAIHLDSMAILQGWVPLPSGIRRAWVQIYGMERGAFTDTAGHFQLDSLPPGELMVRAIAQGVAVALGEQRVLLNPGGTHRIDTLPPLEDGGGELSTWRSLRRISTARLQVPPPLDTVSNLPLLLQLDADMVDFLGAEPDGADLRITDTQLRPVLFEIRHWDAAARKARLWVRLPSSLAAAPDSLVLHWGRAGARSASRRDLVWLDISDTLRQQLTTILVEDFEGGRDRNLLGHSWFARADETSVLLQPTLDEPMSTALRDASPRTGNALQFRYLMIPSDYTWVLAGTSLAETVRDFRGLDSIEFWAKGTGFLWVALENSAVNPVRKAWATLPLDSQWRRHAVRPDDFHSPGPGYNIGWPAIRDSVNLLTFFGLGGGEFWVDDIRLHGLSPQELR